MAELSGWGRAAFDAKRIALIGASEGEGKAGRLLMGNLAGIFQGELYPIHPSRNKILGYKAFPAVTETPERCDLAVIVAPPPAVEKIIDQCVEAQVSVAVILTGGFAESGREGAAIERRISAKAKETGLRIVGPNCFGVINTANALNASLGMGVPQAGGVSLVTQSGSYGMAVFNRSQQGDLGIAKVLALGNKCDVDEIDALAYLGGDPETCVIAMLLESINNGREFCRVAADVTARKPLVILKTGRSSDAARAAASHTAALANDYSVVQAALKQAGATLVDDGLSLLDVSAALSLQAPIRGGRAAIITNSGGTGVELTDLLVDHGMSVPALSTALQTRLATEVSALGSTQNPIDVTTDWARFADGYAHCVRHLLESDEVDVVVPVLLQRSALIPEVTERIVNVVREARTLGNTKPVHVCWVAGPNAEQNRTKLIAAGISCHPWPAHTASIIAHSRAPTAASSIGGVQRALPRPSAPAGWLDPASSFSLLSEAGLPVVPFKVVENSTDAIEAAVELGWPVVVKAIRESVQHKSDVGAVRTDLTTPEVVAAALAEMQNRLGPGPFLIQAQVQRGTELIIGAVRDPSFGAVIVLGIGGVFVEILADRALRLAPLEHTDAEAMLTELRAQALLDGFRGAAPIDRNALCELLVTTARWVAAAPWLAELDINPVIANAGGLHIVDALVRID